MKKSLFTTPFVAAVLAIALFAGMAPVTNAQSYFGNYMNQPYQSCVTLTAFQQPGSTDAYTGGQVSMLQQFLNQTGYLSGVSGTYDNGTLGAVINFQRAYNIQITGTVGPVTRAAINQQSCGAGITNPYGPSYPVTNYSNVSNCYWTGGTYTSTYVCTTGSVVPVAPIAPVYPAPVVCNTWNNGYYGNNNNNNYCNSYNAVVINSLSSVATYNGTSITIKGSGFSASGNTVYFGNSVTSNVYSSDGTTLTFTVPVGYYSGTYSINVKNALGMSSNSLSYIMSNVNYWNNNNYNGSLSLSNISGPSGVQTGVTNTWTVTTSGSNSNVTLHANWGDNYGVNAGSDTQQAYSYGSRTYSFSHVYQVPGTYTLRITATDSAGNSSYSTYVVTVTGNNNNNYYYPYRGW